MLISVIIFTSLIANSIQTPWNKETAQGFPIYNGELETTEGFGAYLDFCLKPNTKNLDNGGGTHDYNTLFLKKYLGVTNIVYDPYQRSLEHNKEALSHIDQKDFDTATSNSVLNVIDTKEDRIKHIQLSCKALKTGGIAYFKVFSGDSTGMESKNPNGYQSNQKACFYKDEVEAVFGKGNVVCDIQKDLIIAYKNSDCTE